MASPVAPSPAPAPVSGAAVLQSDEYAEQAAILRDMVLGQAAEARDDLHAFFEFVLTEEHTGNAIKVVPHQRVMIDFVLHHDRGVIMSPANHGKTFLIVGYALWRLGRNPTSRFAVVSATEDQAAKVLKAIRDHIDTNFRLRVVFPELQKSTREGDPWTQTAITVQRQGGIRDASVVAVGLDSQRVPGSRWSDVFIDDVLTQENAHTEEQRSKVALWLDSEVTTRLDPRGAKIILTNTARHPDDAPHRLVRHPTDDPSGPGWAQLLMQIEGDVFVRDDAENVQFGKESFDSPALRAVGSPPADETRGEWCRLEGRRDGESLWPERFPMTSDDPKQTTVEKLRLRNLPSVFNQTYMQICRSDEDSLCKQEYVDLCKLKARERGVYGFTSTYRSELIFTGVDLAVGLGDQNDDTAIFTFVVLPDGYRQILEIQRFKGDVIKIRDAVIETHNRYQSIVRVENNGAQEWLVQLLRKANVSMPVRSHTTTSARANPVYGVPAIFLEMAAGAWLIPNNARGEVHPHVQRWIDACLYYTPARHIDDSLMASYFAHAQAREFGVLTGGDVSEAMGGMGIAATVMTR